MGTSLFKTGRFTRLERVKRSSDIKKLFKNGNKVSTKGAKFFYLPNQLGINRIAFAIPRGYGNAVQRNKSKRISREIYRHFKMSMKLGYEGRSIWYSGLRRHCQRKRGMGVSILPWVSRYSEGKTGIDGKAGPIR